MNFYYKFFSLKIRFGNYQLRVLPPAIQKINGHSSRNRSPIYSINRNVKYPDTAILNFASTSFRVIIHEMLCITAKSSTFTRE